jgi:hypothetical protein
MTQTTRRGLLARAALAGGALILPSSALVTTLSTMGCASSQARRTDHYFVFYYMMGGWDLMLSTDPLTHSSGMFVPYDDDEIVEHGSERFGPAMKALLPYADRMAIMRGIHCDALNHPQARFRMTTGQFKPAGNFVSAPSAQTLIARKIGLGYEMPNLSSDSTRPATFRGDDPNRVLEPVRIESVDQLKSMVNVRGEMGPYRNEIAEALAARDQLTRKGNDGNALATDFGEFADLARALAGTDYRQRVRAMEGGKNDDRWAKQARMAVEAIKHDVAPVVTIGTGEFDAHTRSNYGGHANAVIRGFRTVAEVCAGLKAAVDTDGRTLLDKTTIVVTSEFSRAPSRNELGGKHHWPTNSMLLIGKNVRRRKESPVVFGATDDGLAAMPINPRNGSHSRGAELLDMSHALATVLASAGLDPIALIGQDPIDHLLA